MAGTALLMALMGALRGSGALDEKGVMLVFDHARSLLEIPNSDRPEVRRLALKVLASLREPFSPAPGEVARH